MWLFAHERLVWQRSAFTAPTAGTTQGYVAIVPARSSKECPHVSNCHPDLTHYRRQSECDLARAGLAPGRSALYPLVPDRGEPVEP